MLKSIDGLGRADERSLRHIQTTFHLIKCQSRVMNIGIQQFIFNSLSAFLSLTLCRCARAYVPLVVASSLVDVAAAADCEPRGGGDGARARGPSGVSHCNEEKWFIV